MRIKRRRDVTLPERIGAGTHLASISKVEVIADGLGNIKRNKNNDSGISITFDIGEKVFVEQFWYGKKTQWKLDLLMAACGADNTEAAIDADDMLEKKVWLFIAEEHYRHDGEILTVDGERYIHDRLIPNKFAEAGDRPHSIGDPSTNNGVAAGMFVSTTDAIKALGYELTMDIWSGMNKEE